MAACLLSHLHSQVVILQGVGHALRDLDGMLSDSRLLSPDGDHHRFLGNGLRGRARGLEASAHLTRERVGGSHESHLACRGNALTYNRRRRSRMPSPKVTSGKKKRKVSGAPAPFLFIAFLLLVDSARVLLLVSSTETTHVATHPRQGGR